MSYYAERRPPTDAELRRWAKPCRTKYQHPTFQGQHNVVGIYDKGRLIGRRCVSCDARSVAE